MVRDKFLQFMALVNRSGKLLKGYNKCEEAIKLNKLKLLIISNNCSENTSKKFKHFATTRGVEYIEKYTDEELGEILGVSSINVIGVLDQNMSEKLKSLYEA